MESRNFISEALRVAPKSLRKALEILTIVSSVGLATTGCLADTGETAKTSHIKANPVNYELRPQASKMLVLGSPLDVSNDAGPIFPDVPVDGWDAGIDASEDAN